MVRVKKTELVLLVAVAASIVSVSNCEDEAKPVRCVYSCDHRLEGHFVDCKRCDYFVQCANSLMFRMKCPPGLYFEHAMMVCTDSMPDYCDADGNYIGPGSGGKASSGNPHVTSPDPPPQTIPDPPPQTIPDPAPPSYAPKPKPAPAPYDPFASLDSLFEPQPPARNPPAPSNPADPYSSLDNMFGKVDGNNIRPEHLGTSLDDYFNGNFDLNNLGTVVDFGTPADGSSPYGTQQAVRYDTAPKLAAPTPTYYQECTETCVDKPNGRYAYCKYCNDFVECRDGELEVVKCYDDHYYNYKVGRCEIDTDYVCIPRPHEPAPNEPAPYEPAPNRPAPYEPAPNRPAPYEPVPAVYTPPETSSPSGSDNQATVAKPCTSICMDANGRYLPTGNYPSCEYCDAYVTCEDSAKVNIMPCPRGTHYDASAGVCNHGPCSPGSSLPSYRSRGGTPTHVAPPPYRPAAPTDTSRPKTPEYGSEQKPRTAKPCTSTCMDANGKYLPTGNYPSCEYCDAYVACEDGAKVNIMPCPRGTHYDASAGVCNHGPCSPGSSLPSYRSRGGTPTQVAPPPYKPEVAPPPYKPAAPTDTSRPRTPGYGSEQKPRIFKGCTSACRDSYGNPIPSGQYPDCQYCNAYIVCSEGRLSAMSCPERTYYDPDSGVCGHEPQDGRCIASTPEEPEPPQAAEESEGAEASIAKPGHSVAKVGETVHPTCIASCFADGANAADGLYANCEYCDQFIRCEGYKESRGLCGRYMFYNAKYGTCVEDTNYVCSSPPPESKHYVHLPEETIHPACIDSCYGYTDIEYGLYAICDQCDHYIRCEAHKEERGLCREGRYYNAETGSCDLDTEDTCKQSKRPGIPVYQEGETVYPLCIDSCQGYDTPVGPGLYARCSNCDQYVRCGGSDYEKTGVCGRGRFYNAEEGTCDLDVDNTCSPSNRQGKNIAKEGETVNPYCIETCFDDGGYVVAMGLYANCAACDQYIRCEGHTEQQGLCNHGYVYNAEHGACEEDVDDTCEPTKKPGVPVSKAGEIVHPNCIDSCSIFDDERVPDGIYAYCPQCDQYIRCGPSVQIIDVCARGKFYNAVRGSCDEDTDNTCIPTEDDPAPTSEETARPYPPQRQPPPTYRDQNGQPLPAFYFPHEYPTPEFYTGKK